MTDISKDNLIATMKAHKICVIVPTYNNAGTLYRVIEDICQYASDIILVNDGSTDSTISILSEIPQNVDVVSYEKNKGKGHAIKIGFKRAIERGFDYAITIDSDGQHYAKDIPLFCKAIVEHPNSIIIGQRDLSDVDINGKSSFANKFSNFWFCVQTGISMKDTQTGFRAYPLHNIYGLKLLTSRYEAELELLVFAAWNGVNIVSIPIHVYYPPQAERVSHFRPGPDFTRISILNTFLCAGALLYGLPVKIWNNIVDKRFFNFEFKPFTRKRGEKKEAATTLGRVCRSLYGISHFVFWSMAVFTPFAFIYLGIGKTTERKKIRFHKMLKRISSFFAKNFPGSGTIYDNPENEDFLKPAVVICNHQSHLDLPVLMSVSHKFIFLTNDWVWNNLFFGKIVHWAEYIPVSAGIDVVLPKLKDLVHRGYSIVIFPEGTRSADCTIQRFHQGAFYIAQELKLDIVPMVIHGAGHYLPKNDFMFRRGMITLKTLARIKNEDLAGLIMRKQASEARRIIAGTFNDMIYEFETPTYFKSLVLYKYAYRGWKIVKQCKLILKHLSDFEAKFYPLDKNLKSVFFINSGIGVIPLLCALANKQIEVHGLEENMKDYQVSTDTSSLPKNLEFTHIVWEDDYNIIPNGSKVFVIGNHEDSVRFTRFNPILIQLTDD